MHGAKAFLLKSVVIFRIGITRFYPRLNKGSIQRILHIITRGDSEGTIAAAEGIFPARPAFRFFEIRQAVAIVPIVRALSLPLIEIFGMATDIYHPVYRR